MAASPSNAAADNYFKLFSKPKHSIVKQHKNNEVLLDVNQTVVPDDVGSRGGSVSKVET